MTNPDIERKWWIFFACSFMIFLINVDATIVNLALATIAKSLQASLAQIQWVINAYVMMMVICFIIGGRVADIVGRKPVFLTGVVLFGLGSLIAGLSTDFAILLIGRFFQGIGAALTLGLAIIMIVQAFPAEQKGFVTGLSITLTGLGMAVGPTLGGAILSELNWHWIFLINIPFVIFSVVLIALFKSNVRSDQLKEKIDILGSIFLASSLAALLLSISDFSNIDGFSLKWVGEVVCFFLFLFAFILRQLKAEHPIVNFYFFKIRNYSLAIIIRFCNMFAYGIFLFLIPLYLQNALGISVLTAGLMLLVCSAMVGIASPMTGLWCDNSGFKPPLLTSSICVVLAYLGMTQFNLETSMLMILGCLALLGLSFGIYTPASVNTVMSSLPETNSGEGMGIFFTFAFLGISLGVAISSTLMNHLSAARFYHQHSALVSHFTVGQNKLLHSILNGALTPEKLVHLFPSQHLTQLTSLVKHSFIHGFSVIMILNVCVCFVALIGAFSLVSQQDK